MRIKLFAFFALPLLAFGQVRVGETGAYSSPVIGIEAIRVSGFLAPETINWQMAVIANGGSFSRNDSRAVNYFVTECKRAGIWTLIDRVNLFAGRNLNAALVPVKAALGTSTETNSNFVEADFNAAIGLTGNGSTKLLTPGVNANQTAQNDTSLFAWITNAGTAGTNRWIIGTLLASGCTLFHSSTNQTSARIHCGSPVNHASTGVGFVFGARTAAALQLARYNSSETTDTTASTSPANAAISVFSSGAAAYHSGALGAYGIGKGMDGTQRAALQAILLQTMTMLGRPTA